MAQNRKPPAFQEYAATFLASKDFRLMSLEERGLLMTMRFECWENLNIPSNNEELATYLGFRSNIPLTSRVMSFFVKRDSVLICPELEDYRQHINERKAKQSIGGKKGAKKTNYERATRQGTCESLVQFNLEQLSSNQSLESDYINDEFVKDYEGESNGY